MSFIEKLKVRGDFTRNILTLVSGTAFSQILLVAVLPILTRVYTPEDFGQFSFFVAIISLVSILLTGRYELALSLPKGHEKINSLFFFTVKLCVLNSVIILILLYTLSIFTAPIGELGAVFYLIPLSSLLFSLIQVFNYFMVGKGEFKKLAYFKVLQSTFVVFFQISLAYTFVSESGLIYGHSIGLLVPVFIFLVMSGFGLKIIDMDKRTILKQLAMARRYIRFPQYLVISHLLNTSALQGSFILMNLFLNSKYAGFFALIYKVLTAPISLIGVAVGDVFRKEASQKYNENFECKKLYLNTFKKLVLLSFFPFLILFVISTDLFALVFGSEWAEAGELARYLIPMTWLMFISSPLSSMFLIAEKQKYDLYFQLFFVFCIVTPFLIFSIFKVDVDMLFLIYAVLRSLAYVLNICISYKLSCGKM